MAIFSCGSKGLCAFAGPLSIDASLVVLVLVMLVMLVTLLRLRGTGKMARDMQRPNLVRLGARWMALVLIVVTLLIAWHDAHKTGALSSAEQALRAVQALRAAESPTINNLQRRIGTLEAEITFSRAERDRADELSTAAADSFRLVRLDTRAPAGVAAIGIAQRSSADTAFCSKGAQATFVVSWSPAGAEHVAGAQLMRACPWQPNKPSRLHVRLPERAGAYTICARAEMINLNETDAVSTLGACSRLSLYVGRTIGCVNVSVPRRGVDAAEPHGVNATAAPSPCRAAGRAGDASSRCDYQSWQYGEWDEGHRRYTPLGCVSPSRSDLYSPKLQRQSGRGAASLPPKLPPKLPPLTAPWSEKLRAAGAPRAPSGGPPAGKWWLLVIGDSVTQFLVAGGLLNVPLSRQEATGQVRVRDDTLACACGSPMAGTRFRCVSQLRWFDSWSSPTLNLPTGREERHRTPLLRCLQSAIGATEASELDATGPTHIYLSTGSHNPVVAGDAHSRERYFAGFATWFRQLPLHTVVVLALEGARDPSVVPHKYSSLSNLCTHTNVRTEERNGAAMAAFLSLCQPRGPRACRVFDLFTLSLPTLFDRRFYKIGDPIHFFGRCQDGKCSFVREALGDVLRSLAYDAGARAIQGPTCQGGAHGLAGRAAERESI